MYSTDEPPRVDHREHPEPPVPDPVQAAVDRVHDG
jgi:hypothetical protein